MTLICKYWDKYKGIRRPKCSGGKGCKMCWAIYNSVNGVD